MSVVKWYKRDPNAALGGMMVLTLEERGAYSTVLDLIYSHDNNLIDDDRFISGWLRCDVRVWRRIKSRLVELGKIELKGGLVTNFRATSEIDEALSTIASVSELNRIKGIKSGIARNKNKDLPEPTVEPDANIPTPTTREERKTVTTLLSKERRGTRIPENFEPDASCHELAESLLLSSREGQEALENFLDYWRGVPAAKGLKLDWQATFRNQLRHVAKQKGKTNGARTSPRPNSIAGSFAVVDAAIDAERRRIEALEREIGQLGEGAAIGGAGSKLLS